MLINNLALLIMYSFYKKTYFLKAPLVAGLLSSIFLIPFRESRSAEKYFRLSNGISLGMQPIRLLAANLRLAFYGKISISTER